MLVQYNKTLAPRLAPLRKAIKKTNSLYIKNFLDFNKFSLSLSRKLINCIIFL